MDAQPCMQDKAQDLSALIEAARRLAEGDCQRVVTIEATGELGQLAHYLNQTMQNLRTTEQLSLRLVDAVHASARDLVAMKWHLEVLTRNSWVMADISARQALATLRGLMTRIQERDRKSMGPMECQDVSEADTLAAESHSLATRLPTDAGLITGGPLQPDSPTRT